MDTAKQYWVQHLQGFSHNRIVVFYRIVLRCRSHKCRQVLSYSSSSQIPGTCERVVVVVISIWLSSAFLSLMTLWVPLDNRSLFISIGTGICLLVTTVVYIKIYLAVKRHKNQIQALQVQNPNFASLIKSAVSTFWVYLVFLVCYLPMLICLAVLAIYDPNITSKITLLFSCTLVFLNSSLNPVIYCWKMRHIRQAVMNILRNMSWQKKRLSR